MPSVTNEPLTIGRLKVLSALLEGPANQRELARRTGMSDSSIVNMFLDFFKAGIIDCHMEGRQKVWTPKDPEKIKEGITLIEEGLERLGLSKPYIDAVEKSTSPVVLYGQINLYAYGGSS